MNMVGLHFIDSSNFCFHVRSIIAERKICLLTKASLFHDFICVGKFSYHNMPYMLITIFIRPMYAGGSLSPFSYLFVLLCLSDPKLFLCFLSTGFLSDLKSKQTHCQYHQLLIHAVNAHTCHPFRF